MESTREQKTQIRPAGAQLYGRSYQEPLAPRGGCPFWMPSLRESPLGSLGDVLNPDEKKDPYSCDREAPPPKQVSEK